jgi:iron complex outermembrane receptor protein
VKSCSTAVFAPLIIALFLPLSVAAQDDPSSEPSPPPPSVEADASPEAEAPAEIVYSLPEAEVSAERDTPEVITREELDRDGANDLWESVRYIPGVLLSGGGRRNESSFSIRGYGADSVPIFVDGIPMANPYRGDGDSARFLTGDLESVEIKKGYSSELLGANTLGGAVLLRTAKPRAPFEASLKSNLDLDSIGHYADSTHVAALGTKLDMFYGKAVFQFRDVNHFRLPDDFKPTAYNPQEKGDRLWSDSKDLKLTLMAGLTPLPSLDVWLTYLYQYADKGVSPPDTVIRDYAVWDWPVWKRWSVSLNSAFNIGPVEGGAMFYFDKYDNRMDEYLSPTHYEFGLHRPHSDYDEYTMGGRLTAGWEINSRNIIEGALTYKKEDHVGLRGNYMNEDMAEEIHVNEDTWSMGLEYVANPWPPLTLKGGIGLDTLIPNEYWNEENEYLKVLGTEFFIVKTREMYLYTWQAGVFYTITEAHALRLTYARKNHFPTMSQRYSTRFGDRLPNPNLGPEIANHVELGYQGNIDRNAVTINVDAAAYYSVMTGKIVDIEIPDPYYPAASIDYARNLDAVHFWGFECSPELTWREYLTVGLAFSLNKYAIGHSQAGVQVLTDYPEITLNGYLEIKPVEMLSIMPRFEYLGRRWADTRQWYELDGYVLANLQATVDLGRHFTLSVSVDNIFDTLYEIRKYSPQPGRTYSLTFTARY